MDLVVVSSVMCAAEPAERHSSELPDICNDSDVSGPLSASVQFGDEVDELNLQCIGVDGLGEAPGLPVPEFRDPVMVSEFASDIDPGTGGSSGRAGHAGSLAGLHWVPGAGTSRVYTAIRMVATRNGFSC